MKSQSVKIGLMILIFLLLCGLAAGGFMLYQKVQIQHKDNLAELEKFGYQMVPTDRFEETIGTEGNTQLPATFSEKELTPTQKVIHSLVRDKESLLDENRALSSQIEDLKKQILELEDYRRLNERFAPETVAEETARVESELKAYLVRNREAERFSNLQIEIMSAAGASEYKEFVNRNRLILDDDRRSEIISRFMPSYAFCVGDGVDVAANSNTELRQISRHIRNPGLEKLTNNLQQDLESVMTPCKLALRQELEKWI